MHQPVPHIKVMGQTYEIVAYPTQPTRRILRSVHEPRGAPRLRACSTTALLPTNRSPGGVRSPIGEFAPSLSLPSVEYCLG